MACNKGTPQAGSFCPACRVWHSDILGGERNPPPWDPLNPPISQAPWPRWTGLGDPSHYVLGVDLGVDLACHGQAFQVEAIVRPYREPRMAFRVGWSVLAQDEARARQDFVRECLEMGDGELKPADILVTRALRRVDWELWAAALTTEATIRAKKESHG